MKVCRRAPTRHPRQSVAMGKGDNALRLRETNGVGVVTVFTEVVVPSAVVTIPPGQTVPNGVSRLKLMTEVAAMGEWGGPG